MNLLQNVPLEIRQVPNWVTWKLEQTDNGRDTKIPYNPATGLAASTTDPRTWVPFEQAAGALTNGYWSGTGYNLADNDPFAFVDLDDPHATNPDGTPKHKEPQKIEALQREVYARFRGTYAEISPSGKGLHIICKGIVPSGRRRHGIEVYSSARFMTMTGNRYEGTEILDRQEALTWLYNEMGGAPVVNTAFVGEYFDTETDDKVIAKVLNAANGAKVRDLVTGNWQQYYSSQSEADFALIDIIAYYTKSRFQIVRLFRQSALGQRDKANRDAYVLGMVDRAFDRQPAPLDIEGMTIALEREFGRQVAGAGSGAQQIGAPGAHTPLIDGPAVGASTPKPITAGAKSDNPYLRPVPGLLGQIAYYIYDQAPRPVPEIALAGAIGLMAGICGRAFNVSGTGLNQYTLLLTGTGRGKEAIQSGISKLMGRVSDIEHGGCPAAVEFIGPSDIASGQALIKHFDKMSKSFISIVGEVDVTLKNMTARNANAALTRLRQVLLSAYSVSGRGNVLGGTIYSDREKNAAPINSPAFSMLGEGTPDRFYNLLDEAMVSDGLLPRFLIIEYAGERVGSNDTRMNLQPGPELVNKVATLCGQALMLNQQNRPLDVKLDAEADAMFKLFDRTVDGIINKAGNDTIEQLWNRAHLKALKLAALIAVGCNASMPTITKDMAEYAIDLIRYSTDKLVAKFNSGDIGDGFNKQMADMRKCIKSLLHPSAAAAKSLGLTPDMVRDGLLSHRGLQQRIANYVSYKNAREGTGRAYDAAIKSLLDGGVLAVVGPTDLKSRYGLDRGRYYVLANPHYINE